MRNHLNERLAKARHARHLGDFKCRIGVAAMFLIERTLEGALKAVKVALKGEFTTDVGRLNLAGMVVLWSWRSSSTSMRRLLSC